MDRPELPPELAFYLEAFYLLSASRDVGFGGAGPIKLTEMLAFCDLHGIRGTEDRLGFINIMRALDAVWLEKSNEKSKALVDAKGKPIKA